MARLKQKDTSRSSKKAKFRLGRRSFRALVVMILVGCIGSYLLVSSGAYNNDKYELYFADPENTDIHPAGTTFSKKLYTNTVPQVSGKLHVDLTVKSHRSRVAYIPSFTCASALTCTPGDGYESVPSYVDGPRQDFHTCVDIDSSKIGKSFVHLLTIRYKSLQTKEYSMIINAAWASGSCNRPSGAFTLNHIEGWLIGRCISGSDADCEGGHQTEGPDSATKNSGGDKNTSSDKANTGDAQTSGDDSGGNTGNDGSEGGGGSAGGGSLANTIDDKPSKVPSSSSQGKNDQPELQPSPFYDGKEYAPGSNPDTGVVGAVSVVGKAAVNMWPYVAVVLLLLGAGVVLYLRYKKHNKK